MGNLPSHSETNSVLDRFGISGREKMSENIKDVSMVDINEAGNKAGREGVGGADGEARGGGQGGGNSNGDDGGMVVGEGMSQTFSQLSLGRKEGRVRSGKRSTTLLFDYQEEGSTCQRVDGRSNSDIESMEGEGQGQGQGQQDGNVADARVVSQQQQQSGGGGAPAPADQGSPLMVPVDITWQQGGTKVYVTGSFTGWRKMIGLVAAPNNPGLFHIKLQLPPGTHRFRFIVDNELRFSDFLPTATDQMGNFVNYMEIVASPPSQEQQPASDLQYVSDEGPISKHVENIREGRSDAASAAVDEERGMSSRSKLALQIEDDPDDMGDGYTRFREESKEIPVYEFTQDIPAVFTDPSVMGQYYLTLDQQKNNQQNLAWLTPPQLPPHLEHVILNHYNKSADGASENTSGALPIPNHVVLNHLATSSIKHNTLCVASIVRYKSKYATQILYAPLH
ncbi:Sip2p Ecym_1210 [Eremothecium cymbalariae DBVPG|uniref:Association with the SNF1 complex (ASC) domain-containing protein n=1 Tax=Eremothecium cymbalariae (strain CBS 270.75 / DBVPG 7215 / KCTC 17166 / NRRL Y-17582) TaxID=931890 RepID=G8JMZ3_ERECY|nr:hypothetical protein Ecym_1210 [Eremothecium cymbalariae DBVPG\